MKSHFKIDDSFRELVSGILKKLVGTFEGIPTLSSKFPAMHFITDITKKLFFILIISLVPVVAQAQDMKKFNLYKPQDKAEEKIALAVKRAKASGKHVFIQVGGNWCIWCARFNDFVTTDKSLDSLIKANYEVYHLSHSPENTNSKLLAKYGYPQRMGFPVFLILNAKGKLIHTQNSAYLENGQKSYNRDNVMSFLSDWTPAALDSSKYLDK